MIAPTLCTMQGMLGMESMTLTLCLSGASPCLGRSYHIPGAQQTLGY